MKGSFLVWSALGVSAGALLYGALVEANRLVRVERDLALPYWPSRLDGYRIALLADLHLGHEWSVRLARRAVNLALDAEPDMVVMAGDFVSYWKADSAALLGDALESLLLLQGNVVAVPGNHDHLVGDPSLLRVICDEFEIKLLRNEHWVHHGITWVGVDSANARAAQPEQAFRDLPEGPPVVALWHEPDVVEVLPPGASLMLSGHSHGGQFLTPWGAPFIGSRNGRRYRRGWHPNASTPLYVTSGVGTTGPPSRLFCPPEVCILNLYSDSPLVPSPS